MFRIGVNIAGDRIKAAVVDEENPENNKSEIDLAETVEGGSIEILEEVAAVDNIFCDVKSVKRIENGQVIIIRNGVRYNLLGTEVR